MTHPSVNSIVERLEPCPFCGNPPVHTYSSGIFCATEGCVIDGVHCMDPSEWNNRPFGIATALKPFAEAASGSSSIDKPDDFLIWQNITVGDLRRAESAWNTRPAATIISELQAERDDLRKYCSAAANDYNGMLMAMERTIAPALAEAFKSTAKELRETSNFMRLAAEGRASGLIYDDELSKAKSELAAAESSLSRIKEETIEECAKVAELTRVSANGHPQIDAPTPHDMKLAIASAIRSLDNNCSGKTAESGNSAPTRERE